jgi:hypothetical protein
VSLPRRCLKCRQLFTGARCPRPACSSRQARGYGLAHQAARQALKATLPAPCAYGCGTILYPTSDWVAAHRIDGDPHAGWIASCRLCNERAKRR